LPGDLHIVGQEEPAGRIDLHPGQPAATKLKEAARGRRTEWIE
jgi:hypothetical protein